MSNIIIISSKEDTNSEIENFLFFWLKKNNYRIHIYEKCDEFNYEKDYIFIVLQDKNIQNYISSIDEKNYILLINFYQTDNKIIRNNFCSLNIRLLDRFLDNDRIPPKFNYTCIEDFKKIVLQIIKDKRKKYISFFNPGEVLAYDINQFYNKAYKIGKENVLFEPYSNLRNISNDFKTLDCDKKVNIYIPVYYRLKKTINCLESIKRLAENSIYDIKIYVGDNNTKLPEMNQYLKNCGLNVYFSPENLGKAGIINKIHSNARKCNYIFSIDGDMCYDPELIKPEFRKYNLFDKMIECLEKTKNTGLVSSFQYIQSEHWFNGTIKKIKERGFNIGITNTGIGIAGGCVVLREKDWKTIGGYKQNHDIYTGDDSILTYKIYRHLHKKCAIYMDMGMVHPPPEEEEKGYSEWKKKSWMRDNVSFIKDDYKGSNKKGYYD